MGEFAIEDWRKMVFVPQNYQERIPSCPFGAQARKIFIPEERRGTNPFPSRAAGQAACGKPDC